MSRVTHFETRRLLSRRRPAQIRPHQWPASHSLARTVRASLKRTNHRTHHHCTQKQHLQHWTSPIDLDMATRARTLRGWFFDSSRRLSFRRWRGLLVVNRRLGLTRSCIQSPSCTSSTGAAVSSLTLDSTTGRQRARLGLLTPSSSYRRTPGVFCLGC